jgi:hypothetical protein
MEGHRSDQLTAVYLLKRACDKGGFDARAWREKERAAKSYPSAA